MKTSIYFKRYIKNDPNQKKEIRFHGDNGYINFNEYRGWLLNERYHNENGPARTWGNGHKEWYLFGRFYEYELEFREALKEYKRKINLTECKKHDNISLLK